MHIHNLSVSRFDWLLAWFVEPPKRRQVVCVRPARNEFPA